MPVSQAWKAVFGVGNCHAQGGAHPALGSAGHEQGCATREGSSCSRAVVGAALWLFLLGQDLESQLCTLVPFWGIPPVKHIPSQH